MTLMCGELSPSRFGHFHKTVSLSKFTITKRHSFATLQNLSDNLRLKIVSKSGHNFQSVFLLDFGKTPVFRYFRQVPRESDFFAARAFARKKQSQIMSFTLEIRVSFTPESLTFPFCVFYNKKKFVSFARRMGAGKEVFLCPRVYLLTRQKCVGKQALSKSPFSRPVLAAH